MCEIWSFKNACINEVNSWDIYECALTNVDTYVYIDQTPKMSSCVCKEMSRFIWVQ